MDKAAERAVALGAEAMQLFTQSPRTWRPTNHKAENIARFRQICDDNGIRSKVAHALYLINLGSPDEALYEKSVTALINSVNACEQIGLDGLIFHVGSHQGAGFDSALPRVVEALHRGLEHTENSWVLMENSAGQGGTIGRSVDELARIYDAVGDHPRLGIAIDTCHWFVSGVDVRDPEVLDGALDEIDSKIGLDRLRALHINDSKTPLGSNRDRHENIGDGEIGEGLATFLRSERLQGLPAILEVPGDGDGPTAEELRKVRALHG